MSFHSFDGSVLVGRYPHAFVVFEGTLEEDGRPVSGNYGFTAARVTPAILRGPVPHAVTSERQEYLDTTNRHFSVPLTDRQYRAIMAEIARWRDTPGRFYDLDRRNCIHFVGRLAQLAGLTVAYPHELIRRPKAWLNRIAELNPGLGDRMPD
jgi:hypothetical protein